jgi:hypothetical protein
MLIVPPFLIAATCAKYVVFASRSDAPYWCTDPREFLFCTGLVIGFIAAFFGAPFLAMLVKRRTSNDNTEFYSSTRKDKRR